MNCNDQSKIYIYDDAVAAVAITRFLHMHFSQEYRKVLGNNRSIVVGLKDWRRAGSWHESDRDSRKFPPEETL